MHIKFDFVTDDLKVYTYILYSILTLLNFLSMPVATRLCISKELLMRGYKSILALFKNQLTDFVLDHDFGGQTTLVARLIIRSCFSSYTSSLTEPFHKLNSKLNSAWIVIWESIKDVVMLLNFMSGRMKCTSCKVNN